MYSNSKYALILVTSIFLQACEESESNHYNANTGGVETTTSYDTQLNQVILSKGLNGDPISQQRPPSIYSASSQLGKRLFFSKSLSGNRDTACVTCHHPMLGGGDSLSLPIGVDSVNQDVLGDLRRHQPKAEGYDGGPAVPRNAPTTFNIAAWQKELFFDGRVEVIEGGIRTPDVDIYTADPWAGQNLVHAQARFPVTSKEEMKGFSHNDKNNQQIREFLVQRLGGYGSGVGVLPRPDYWLEKFRNVFDRPKGSAESLITEQNVSFLLAEYQRSQLFMDSPWSRYVRGDKYAISDYEKAGAALFFQDQDKAGAGCASCHSGDFFTDEKFHNIGMPQIGRGKGDIDGNGEAIHDFGRFRETNNESDKYAFRTPTLLNVEQTGPWGHAGSYTSLESVVRHHLKPQNALDQYNSNQLSQPGIQNLSKLKSNTQDALDHWNFALTPQNLSNEEVNQLVAFLKTLTDPCTQSSSCLAPWILSDEDTDQDPNGDQLNAVGLK